MTEPTKENVCFHMFDCYKVVDKDGNETMIAGQTEIPFGTHYGHCIFCKRWIDLTHARIEIASWEEAARNSGEKLQ